jgi:transposase
MKVCGIDVDSRELKVVVRKAGRTGPLKTFKNTPSDHERLAQLLRTSGVKRVCLEATGTYHLDLALALSATPGLEPMVLNPRAARRFAEALCERQKTDKVDAQVLAEFAERMPFVAWKQPSAEVLELRAIARRITALTAQRTQAKNQHHAARASRRTPAVVLEDIELTIDQFGEQIDRLRTAARELIAGASFLRETLALLLSIKGVGETSAIALIGELLVLPEDMRAKQWVAVAGLDPRHHQSGASEKRPRISKAGNRYLRQALYMPALSACRHDPHIAAFRDHLVNQRGLKKIQAVVAVMRKLLHAIHGMLKTGTPFDGARFRALPTTA